MEVLPAGPVGVEQIVGFQISDIDKVIKTIKCGGQHGTTPTSQGGDGMPGKACSSQRLQGGGPVQILLRERYPFFRGTTRENILTGAGFRQFLRGCRRKSFPFGRKWANVVRSSYKAFFRSAGPSSCRGVPFPSRERKGRMRCRTPGRPQGHDCPRRGRESGAKCGRCGASPAAGLRLTERTAVLPAAADVRPVRRAGAVRPDCRIQWPGLPAGHHQAVSHGVAYGNENACGQWHSPQGHGQS